ncbi:MAG TPA: LuxR C-terminal-related transcriptional regulator [Syntrophorhabdaceae bacterium]|nr:LuxR C-terminal-related transcriptional regulator [Syntrophorhabdaceae bacterium]
MKKKIPVATKESQKHLLEQISELRAQLEEAKQTLKAIRNGRVDAVVVDDGGRPHVYTLESPDLPYRSIVETMAAGALTLNESYIILYCNSFFSNMVGIPMEQLIGSSFLDLVPAGYRSIFTGFIERSHTVKSLQELPLKTASGRELYIHLAGGCELRDPHNSCIVVTDISARKSAEDGLDIKSRNLEEVNTALRVLLKQREGDKGELEENILSNVKELVLPHLERLKKGRLDTAQLSTIEIIEGNLAVITSPIVRKMHTFDLTPREIEVVSYLKTGKTTKQIAELLGTSVRSVEFHRYNIRKKLGLDQKKANLRSHLLSL